MNNLQERLQQVRREIAEAERQFGREPGSVKLLAVSKTRVAGDVLALAQLGVSDFGENYVQEARAKIGQLGGHSLTWHFIGPIQSNKTRQIAEHFDWVHSVDRIKAARRLNAARPAHLPPLNICIQVNVDAEATKSGIGPDEVEQLAGQVLPLSRLNLRGLMALPAPTEDFAAQRRAFMKLRRLQERLNETGYRFDTLSMGTTNDMRAAIAEGATVIRIGTALFGPRTR
jgi:pyridoxal phosphate enzyme (YggS family)